MTLEKATKDMQALVAQHGFPHDVQHGIPLVRIVRDGRREDKPRGCSSPKRAFNAIGEIVRCAGFEM